MSDKKTDTAVLYYGTSEESTREALDYLAEDGIEYNSNIKIGIYYRGKQLIYTYSKDTKIIEVLFEKIYQYHPDYGYHKQDDPEQVYQYYRVTTKYSEQIILPDQQ